MAKKQQKATSSTVYVGKALPGLPRFTVFKGGKLPPHVERMLGDNASLTDLIVPVGELQQARADLQTRGSRLYVAARKSFRKE